MGQETSKGESLEEEFGKVDDFERDVIEWLNTRKGYPWFYLGTAICEWCRAHNLTQWRPDCAAYR